VTVDGHLDFSSSRFYGNLLMMGSMICWVVYTFLNKNLDGKYSGMTVITYQSLASIFLFMPFVLPEIKRWPEFGSISPFILANLVFLGVVCSALEYLFYIYAVKRLGATVSTTFLNLIPVVTVVSGTLLLQEKLLWIEVLGMGLIMASIYALNRITSQSAYASENKGKKSSNLATIILDGKRSLGLRLQSLRPICLHIFLMFRLGR
jgi:drug/metabolite transporter (DMT)-like permease